MLLGRAFGYSGWRPDQGLNSKPLPPARGAFSLLAHCYSLHVGALGRESMGTSVRGAAGARSRPSRKALPGPPSDADKGRLVSLAGAVHGDAFRARRRRAKPRFPCAPRRTALQIADAHALGALRRILFWRFGRAWAEQFRRAILLRVAGALH